MAGENFADVIVLASRKELSPEARVWGTGGWLEPEDREALDWLTLVHLLGWTVRVAYSDDPSDPSSIGCARIVVAACDPDELHPDLVVALRSFLESAPVLVIAGVGAPGRAWSQVAGVRFAGTTESVGRLTWIGPGATRDWNTQREVAAIEAVAEPDTEIWAELASVPIIRARRIGHGVLATVCFHASRARDASGAMGSLLKHLLVSSAPRQGAFIDLSGTVILRMDDPGGSQNVFCGNWCYPKLTRAGWRRTGDILAAYDARLSIGYVSGWVDDGDPQRGTLTVDGRSVERVPGMVHDSPLVRYEDLHGHLPGAVSDYAEEFDAIRELQGEDRVSLELHGYTHLYPDRAAWAAAEDRYSSVAWYRELGRIAVPLLAAMPKDQRPLAVGMRTIGRYFGDNPTTLICPGEDFTNFAVEEALDLGIAMIGSYYLAMRVNGRFCWTTHVCAPYLDLADQSWLESDLPVVGYFHDRDLVEHGPVWLEKCLESWRRAGARRFIDYRQLVQIVEAGAS